MGTAKASDTSFETKAVSDTFRVGGSFIRALVGVALALSGDVVLALAVEALDLSGDLDFWNNIE